MVRVLLLSATLTLGQVAAPPVGSGVPRAVLGPPTDLSTPLVAPAPAPRNVYLSTPPLAALTAPAQPGQQHQNGDAGKNGNGNGNGNGDCNGTKKEEEQLTGCFVRRLLQAYRNEFKPKNDQGADEPPPARRALPAPLQSPPFPMSEWQGFPLIGVPVDTTKWALQKALAGTSYGDWLDENRIRMYGWVNGSANWSTSRQSNTVSSYWVDPNTMVLDQAVLRFERQVDSVQTDHWDWGFRATVDYGIDYRYFTAGGWFSDQLLVHNRLYGVDPTEMYFNVYVPGVAQGMILTVGRWIATPDIETQFAPDNYMGTHSLLFTIDVYTETGVMATVMLNDQWTVQAALHAGADMAPWYDGAVPTGMVGVRWVSKDNRDSFYTVLNAVNDAEYQYFNVRGRPSGHHNYNIIQTTWQHKFNDSIHTKLEAYAMWERNAAVGGTPSLGPFQFNSGGGLGPTIPGLSMTYAVLNYTMFKLSDKDFLTVRNDWVQDEHGTRFGFAGNYSSHAIGWTHNFSPSLQMRPEVGYYRSYNSSAFDNGTRNDMWLAGIDFTLRY